MFEIVTKDSVDSFPPVKSQFLLEEYGRIGITFEDSGIA